MATTSAQPPTAAEREGQTTLGLVGHLLDEVSLLFRQEVRLATVEVSRSFSSLLTGATSLAVAGVVLFAGFLVLLAAAVLALALAMPTWAAALIVGGVVTFIGAGLLIAGRAKVRATNLKRAAERSVESLREDKDVLTRRAQ